MMCILCKDIISYLESASRRNNGKNGICLVFMMRESIFKVNKNPKKIILFNSTRSIFCEINSNLEDVNEIV